MVRQENVSMNNGQKKIGFTKGQSYGSILIRISDLKFESLMDSKVEYLPKAERLKVYIFFMV